MSKIKKILSFIVCILILTVLIPILLEYHKVSSLDIQLYDWKQNSNIDYYLSRYVFWGTLVLAILVLFLILIVIFYPKQHLEVKLSDADGKLSVKNSALEGFVSCLVTDHGLINNPTVHVNSRKNKCYINVKGELNTAEDVVNKGQLIQDEIAKGLKQFFGIDHAVKLKISVSDIKPKKETEVTKKNTSRVK